MSEENTNDAIGNVLRDINKGDIRRQIRYDEVSGDFIIENADAPLREGMQDATSFAKEGFA